MVLEHPDRFLSDFRLRLRFRRRAPAVLPSLSLRHRHRDRPADALEDALDGGLLARSDVMDDAVDASTQGRIPHLPRPRALGESWTGDGWGVLAPPPRPVVLLGALGPVAQARVRRSRCRVAPVAQGEEGPPNRGSPGAVALRVAGDAGPEAPPRPPLGAPGPLPHPDWPRPVSPEPLVPRDDPCQQQPTSGSLVSLY